MQNQQLETFIKNYVEAVDSQDLLTTTGLLDPHFRVVMKNNREKDKVTVFTKSDYLKLMAEKKVGGSKRSVNIYSSTWVAGALNAFVVLENEKMLMESFYTLTEEDGQWKLLSDLLFVTFK